MNHREFIELESKGFDALIAATEFFVESTHTETHGLWYQYVFRTYDPKDKPLDWKQEMGMGHCLGKCAGMPVWITVMWNIIDGHLVGFYEATSQVVDYRMVDEWVDSVCKDRRNRHADAMNFGHVICGIRELNKKA